MKIGVALSGGGARGIAHLGVIKALQEQGYEIEAISGVSSGAIVGAMLASGYNPDEILERFLSTKLFGIFRPALASIGLLKLDAVQRIFEATLPVHTFEQLQMPLHICAVDIVKARAIYFAHGDLIKPLLATIAVPVMFSPVQYNDHVLVDGGILNNLPVEPLLGVCRYVVGVHCNPVKRHVRLRSTRHLMERTFQLAVNNTVRSSLQQCDVVIEPDELADVGLLQYSKARDLFEIGYRYTHQLATHIKEELD